jgi:N-acetylglutamate synthase-like GNAT family acetyltransferase
LSVTLRPATAADQPTIRRIVRAARLAPFNLDWPHFIVADASGQIVAVGQVKPHGDGSRELASIAVIPERQGTGLGGCLIRALLARESGQLFLFCAGNLEPFYRQFNFVPVIGAELPPIMRRRYRLGSWFARIFSLLRREPLRLSAMRRAPHAAADTSAPG